MSKGRDGKAGRLGDETRARINDLKGGWKLPGAPADDEAHGEVDSGANDAGPARRMSKPTQPPPLPAPAAKSAVPATPVSTAAIEPAPATRSAPAASSAIATHSASAPSAPLPSLPQARQAKRVTQPPPPPPAAPRSKNVSQPPPAPVKAPPRATRPSLPPAAVVSQEGADDDEPTRLSSMDEPMGLAPSPASGPSGKATGTVRLPDSLPRQTGVLGDIAYLMRVLAKRRSASSEMRTIEAKIADAKEARHTKLLDYARHAIGDESFDQTLVGRARAALLTIEEKRSLHAGRIASANEKVAALERQRNELKKQRAAEVAKLEMEIQAVGTSLQPLVTRATAARKKTTKLRLQLSALDDAIRKKEASLVAVDGAADKASVHAEMASLRAERDAVAQDEPAIAAEIDDLEPKIASLTSSRGELTAKIEALAEEERLDVIRAAEKADAVKASRVVEERAVSDQSVKQQKELLELGEGLHHNPPDTQDPKASAIVRHDLEIGTLERRNLELTELLNSVEKGPMIRGALYLGMMILLPAAGVVYAVLLR